jgi:ribonuclease E
MTEEKKGRRKRSGRRRGSSKKKGTETKKGTASSTRKKDQQASKKKTSKATGGKGRSRGRRRRPRSEIAKSTTRKTMLVSVGSERHQIAVLETGDLVEHYVTHSDSKSLVGNIYLGKVQNVLPGMEAAFVEIGEERNAVLYVKEVGFDEEIEGETPRIEKILRSGQSVLCQVTRDPMRSKGARLTMQVTLPGRYVVLVPESDFIGISRRLPDDERQRLRKLASRVQPPGFGLIVRTAAESAGEDELDRDVSNLVQSWYDISAKAGKGKAPKLIYSEPEMVTRVVRDLFTKDVEKLAVDDKKTFDQLKGYISEVTPDLGDRMELYQDDDLSLFERHHVIEQIRKALDRKVWLPSGGHIVIDRTEAMTVIDVNTGRYVGKSKSSLEETVYKTNLEAADEVAKQLRLRDIGGIIIIDYIDMIEISNRKEVIRRFKEALASDKTRTQVFDISELGILEMTRKNVSEGLLESFSELCETCEGSGLVLTDLE